MKRKKLEIEKIRIKSKNSAIAAVVHYPQKIEEKLAILLPGYLDSKDYAHLVALAEDLKNKGYTAVRFDPTGTWESGGTIADYTVARQFEDVKSVLERMLHKNAYKQILLGGHSRGGFIAILYAIKDPRISAVLALMPPSVLIRTVNKRKIKQWEKDGFRVSVRDIPGKKIEKKEFRVPYANMKKDKRYNVLAEINNLRVPLLLIAGEDDDIVFSDDVKKIYDQANEPKKFTIIKDLHHDYRLKKGDIKIVNREVLKWLLTF